MELLEPIAIDTKIKGKKDLKESLQILQTWFSPSFPIGSFSYSHGLEAMINDNFIKSKEDILDYLKCILKYGTGKNDIILMKHTYQGEELNELALSLCPSKERKIESIEMGNAFRKVLADSWDFKILENTAYPIAVAKAAKHFGIPLNLTIVSYLQSFVSNLINVCIKLEYAGKNNGLFLIKLMKIFSATKKFLLENSSIPFFIQGSMFNLSSS